tara:strand:- start:3118 stop:3309 length:192 start_codon:yes stop_codon:yes gene_type:complete
MDIVYKIHGYDRAFSENYIRPREYKTFEEAFARRIFKVHGRRFDSEFVVKYEQGAATVVKEGA